MEAAVSTQYKHPVYFNAEKKNITWPRGRITDKRLGIISYRSKQSWITHVTARLIQRHLMPFNFFFFLSFSRDFTNKMQDFWPIKADVLDTRLLRSAWRVLVWRSTVQSTANCKRVNHKQNFPDWSTAVSTMWDRNRLRRKHNEIATAQDVYNFLFIAQTVQLLDYRAGLARNTGFDSREGKKIFLFSTSSRPAVIIPSFLYGSYFMVLSATTLHFYYYYGSTAIWGGALAAFSFSWAYTQSVGLLKRGSSPSQGLYLHRIDAHNTDIHALGGIRTYDPRVRASEDSSCFRPRGHNYTIYKWQMTWKGFRRKWWWPNRGSIPASTWSDCENHEKFLVGQ
jgi:hypothetical protein